jgi:hypothetical protein
VDQAGVDRIPRIKSVTAISAKHLHVVFEDASERVYDGGPLLDRPQFELLRTPAFFRAVRLAPGGYGISWNDAMDLSECELWKNGQPMGEIAHLE